VFEHPPSLKNKRSQPIARNLPGIESRSSKLLLLVRLTTAPITDVITSDFAIWTSSGCTVCIAIQKTTDITFHARIRGSYRRSLAQPLLFRVAFHTRPPAWRSVEWTTLEEGPQCWRALLMANTAAIRIIVVASQCYVEDNVCNLLQSQQRCQGRIDIGCSQHLRVDTVQRRQ
jgi:hypothetical protein